jgi:hypothetical protein
MPAKPAKTIANVIVRSFMMVTSETMQQVIHDWLAWGKSPASGRRRGFVPHQ